MKAREAKLGKEREGLEGAVARLEAQRVGLDAELAQMRRMLEDAGRWLGWLARAWIWNAGRLVWYQGVKGHVLLLLRASPGGSAPSTLSSLQRRGARPATRLPWRQPTRPSGWRPWSLVRLAWRRR